MAIGLMGFGRIGRNVFRQLRADGGPPVGAIVDIADPASLAYLLRYDSIYGQFPEKAELQGGSLVVGDDRIPMLDARQPGEVDWGALGVDVVVQAANKYRTAAWCSKHLEAGARRVILASTPEKTGDIPLLLKGVNDHILDSDPPIVSMGSNTSNAMAPLVEVLDGFFDMERLFFTTVHAFTNNARLGDAPSSEFRTSRAAGENIIPTDSNSADILAAVFPNLRGRIASMALNVPVDDASTVDAVSYLKQDTTLDEVNEAMRLAAENRFPGVLGFTQDPIVSSDVRSSTFSGLYDSGATMVVGGRLVKTVVWFDNGWGYAARIVELLRQFLNSEVKS